MGRTSTTNSFLDWIRRFRRPFLRLVLVTLGLFVIVPQMALVDSDNDGITDLSAIAIAATPIAHPSISARKDQAPKNSHNTVALAPDAIQSNPLANDKSDSVFHDGHSVLALLCLLRC
jgi:hypothetical protein